MKLSPRAKFIAITLDEFFLVPILIILAYYFAPDLFEFTIIASIAGFIIFVVIKYRLVYDSLKDGSYYYYELEGVVCKAIDDITHTSGKVKIGAEIWDARSHLGDIPAGTIVIITGREYLRLLVKPHDVDKI